MTSCSTDQRPGPRARHPFLAADRGAWVRLGVVVALAVAALAAPVADATQAQFTDSTTVELVYQVRPTQTPTPTPTPSEEPAPPAAPAASAPAPEPTTTAAETSGDGSGSRGTVGRRPGPGEPRQQRSAG
ncbi:hypothetical protein [Cellulomonas biazotea]|uniref:hypothetical protein n=2 Tax=Cellulomonas biazotea TaxID=1709 RepID=UPI0035ED90C1